MMINEKKEVFNHIQKKEFILTPQRKEIINILINKKKHLSAVEIYDLLKGENKLIGLATIYRTLDLLEKENIIVRRDFNNDMASFELIINKLEHNHLICKNCGKIIEIPDVLPEDIRESLLDKYNFHCVQHSTKFYGYCSECHKKEIRKKEKS